MEKLAINGGSPVSHNKIPLTKPFFGDEEKQAAIKAMDSFVSGSGPITEQFEELLCKYLGVKNAVFLNSCTSALHLSLMVAGIKSGEAICPDYTFTSTALAAVLNNVKPVLCDVEESTCNINPELVRKLVNKNTKAIIPVHYAGHACLMEQLNEISQNAGAILVEDAAQAIGAEYKGKKLGNLSDIGCFSFHGTKNVVCGEGGALVTNNDEWAEKAFILREKGTDKHLFLKEKRKSGFYQYVSEGYSYVQSDILAAIALEQLKKADKIIGLRTKHASYLSSHLKGIPCLNLPLVKDYAKPNWHIFAVRVPENICPWVAKALNAEGIMANTHYVPLHMNKFYQDIRCAGNFPVSNKISNSLIRLPLYPSLTKNELDDIVEAVKKVMGYADEKH